MSLTEEQERLLQEADAIREMQARESEEEKNSFFTTDPNYVKDKPVIGIVGHGFVGKAVERCINPLVERFLVDPNYGTNIDQLVDAKPVLSFVCTPTPVLGNGRIDSASTLDAVLKLIRLTKSAVVLKSTVTPDVLDKIVRAVESSEAAARFIYAPEFLTEKNADHEYSNPEYMVLGGLTSSVQMLLEFLRNNTYMKMPSYEKIHIVHPVEASFIKYAINSFLAMKVTFFNELFNCMEDEPTVNPIQVMKALSTEPRLGSTHWRVPGPDGKKGFGGACFPKDLSAFTNYSTKLTLLEKVMEINNNIRSEYDLDDREKVANVKFKEEVEIESNDIDEVLKEEDVLDTTGQIDMFNEDAA